MPCRCEMKRGIPMSIASSKLWRRRLAEGLSRETSGPFSRLPRLLPGRLIVWSVLGVALLAAAMFLMRGSDIPDPGTPAPGAQHPYRAPASPRVGRLGRLRCLAWRRPLMDISSIRCSRATSPPEALRARCVCEIRLSNEGTYPTNFWDSSFRFAVQGQVLSPTSGLDEVLDSHAIKQGVVTFELPEGAARGVAAGRFAGATSSPKSHSI